MDLFGKNITLGDVIREDGDNQKFQVIASKLCGKRRVIEQKLQDTSLDTQVREELALSLIEIKKDLSSLGISEIDYQAFLASEEQSGANATQLELFS